MSILDWNYSDKYPYKNIHRKYIIKQDCRPFKLWRLLLNKNLTLTFIASLLTLWHTSSRYFLFLPIFHVFSYFIPQLVSDISLCLINHILTRPNKIQKMMYVNLLICLWIDKGIQCKYDLFLTLYLKCMFVILCLNKCQRKFTISYFKKYCLFFHNEKLHIILYFNAIY